MKEVKYTEHLRIRLQYRGYSLNLPRRIYQESRERYFDISTDHHIAVHEVRVGGKTRCMMIAYDDYFSYVDIVTIHPVNRNQIENRAASGRWIKN